MEYFDFLQFSAQLYLMYFQLLEKNIIQKMDPGQAANGYS